MRLRLLSFALLLPAAVAAQGTPGGVVIGGVAFEGLPVGARNTVSPLHAEPVADGPDRLYAGGRLIVLDSAGVFRFVDDEALDPAAAPDSRVYSLDVEGDTVWVGLGFLDANAPDANGNPTPSAGGFAVSTDGGRAFAYVPPQLDEPGNAPEDSVLIYGVSVLYAPPLITTPTAAPPYDLDFDPRTGELWVAGWVSGLRSSADFGRSFEREVLPPDTLDQILPFEVQSFPLIPPAVQGDQALNFLAFSVLVDEAGTVWVGTGAGVNRSDTTDVYTFVVQETGETFTDRAWRRFSFDGTPRSVAGDFVLAVEEQPVGDRAFPAGSPENPRNPIWVVHRPACPEGAAGCREENGLTVWTGDDGTGAPIFEPRLVGVRVNDVTFDSTTVYAAGDDGLHVSDNGGATWRVVRTLRDGEGTPIPADPNTPFFSVAVTDAGTDAAALWVGAGDGLFRRALGGSAPAELDRGWKGYRVSVPVQPGLDDGIFDAPDVEAYAYPNPFVVGSGYCRIHFELDAAADIRVRLYDFGMEPVRVLEGGEGRAGANEVVWDGLSDDGARVANGVYFYAVEAGGETFTGKILVVN